MAIVIALAAGPANANDEQIAATDQREATLVLHVVNYAALSRDVLNNAKGHVAMVFRAIAVRIVWVDSEQQVRMHQDGGLHLTVMLLSSHMAEKKISAEGISDDVLGHAVSSYGRAYIFCDRIEKISRGFFWIQLGEVILHEVGHLLLPANGHSRKGIMRANLDVRDVSTFLLQSFDKTQTYTIRTTLMGLTVDAPRR